MTTIKTQTLARLHAALSTVLATARDHGPVLTGGAGGALVGYAAVGNLHPPLLLRIALAGITGIYFAIILDEASIRASAALHRRRSRTDHTTSDETELTQACVRMEAVAQADENVRTEREAAYAAHIHLDAGDVWLGNAHLWQGHHQGASMHLAPGIRLIWHAAANSAANTFTLAVAETATEMPVATAEQLNTHLARRRARAFSSEPLSSWELLV
ncbi:hypothetical protein ACIRL2_45725 [Embleya sp. NPDC127516]|uniref:hypothetical protein n=1 Tax=Embleya sp. NPDC127516 TaxID=3363990 RepID=UPI003802CFD8